MSENNIQPTPDEPIDHDIMDEIESDEIELEDMASEEIESDDIELDDMEPSPEEEAATSAPESISSNEMDIDAALAAVSQLSMLADDEHEEASDDGIEDAEYQSVEAESENYETEPESDFDLPRSITMSRGQMASIIPAFALIVIGGWLTFTLTTSSVMPSTGMLLSVILIGIGAIFLSQWLNSGRWSRGNFFIGVSTLLIGGVQLYLSQVAPATLNSGWTLWIIAIGIALFGTGYLTVPRLPRLSVMGLVVIVAGGIGYILSSGAIDTTVVNFVGNLWFVGVAILIFMLVAPLIRRRQ